MTSYRQFAIAIVSPYESGGGNPNTLVLDSRFCKLPGATGIRDGEFAVACVCGSGYTAR
jgi:hypothetical protein